MKRGLAVIGICLTLVVGAGSTVFPEPEPSKSRTLYFEAEWARKIKLNYQIEDEVERIILSGDEGAGGMTTWKSPKPPSLDVGEAHYDLIVPEAGKYTLWALRYWPDKCGNSALVAFNREPFRQCLRHDDKQTHLFKKWEWEEFAHAELEKGHVTFRLKVMEDGPRYDKFALLPRGRRPSNETAAKAVPQFVENSPVPFALSVSMPTQVLGPDHIFKVTACIRKLVSAAVNGTIMFKGPEGAKLREEVLTHFSMAEGEGFKRIPLEIAFPKDLPRGEHRIRLVLRDSSGKVVSLQSFVIAKPFDWWVLGPLNHDQHLEHRLTLGKNLPFEKAVETTIDDKKVKVNWKRFPYKGYNRFHTMDFEKLWGDCLHRCTYVYTEMDSPSEQDIYMLVNNDDQVNIWLNGKQVFYDPSTNPAVGNLSAVRIHLKEGRNKFLIRLTQYLKGDSDRQQNFWLLRIRLRQRKNLRQPAEVSGGVKCSVVRDPYYGLSTLASLSINHMLIVTSVGSRSSITMTFFPFFSAPLGTENVCLDQACLLNLLRPSIDPLICPKCGGTMRVISYIEEEAPLKLSLVLFARGDVPVVIDPDERSVKVLPRVELGIAYTWKHAFTSYDGSIWWINNRDKELQVFGMPDLVSKKAADLKVRGGIGNFYNRKLTGQLVSYNGEVHIVGNRWWTAEGVGEQFEELCGDVPDKGNTSPTCRWVNHSNHYGLVLATRNRDVCSVQLKPAEKRCIRKDPVTYMTYWFLERYQVPKPRLLDRLTRGRYYKGGPYDPRKELESAFPDFDSTEVNAAVDIIEQQGGAVGEDPPILECFCC